VDHLGLVGAKAAGCVLKVDKAFLDDLVDFVFCDPT
jgi:hypothetical protein